METIAMETIVKIITIVETIILPNIMGTITRETIAKTVETFKLDQVHLACRTQ